MKSNRKPRKSIVVGKSKNQENTKSPPKLNLKLDQDSGNEEIDEKQPKSSPYVSISQIDKITEERRTKIEKYDKQHNLWK